MSTTMESNVGLVVEYDPATVETRVRFPDVASHFCFCSAFARSIPPFLQSVVGALRDFVLFFAMPYDRCHYHVRPVIMLGDDRS